MARQMGITDDARNWLLLPRTGILERFGFPLLVILERFELSLTIFTIVKTWINGHPNKAYTTNKRYIAKLPFVKMIPIPAFPLHNLDVD